MSFGDDEKVYRHESYGVAVVSHRSGRQKTMFQSALSHQHTVSLSIHPAYVRRHLNNDWVHHDGRPYIEVIFTEDQWARMVSSIGMGGGTPCTINMALTEGFKKMEEPPEAGGRGGTREEFTGELEELVNQRMQGVRDALAKLEALEQKKGAPTKGELRELRNLLSSATVGLANSASFILNQFEEAIEKNVSAAKTEFEAHVNATVRNAGMKALELHRDGEGHVKELESRLRGEEDRDD